MSILINKDTRVICQGFTGAQGASRSEQGGSTHHGLPVAANDLSDGAEKIVKTVRGTA